MTFSRKIISTEKTLRRGGDSFSSLCQLLNLRWHSPDFEIVEETAERVGVYVGSGIGAVEVIEREHSKLLKGGPDRVSSFFINASIGNLASGQISIKYDASGPNLTCAAACTTGAHGVGEAWHIIKHGDADVMICGEVKPQ